MRFIMMIYSNPVAWDALSQDERAALEPEHAALIHELMESGEWVGGSVLSDPLRSRTVRVRNGSAVATDGPYIAAKEHIAGYDIIECESMQRAVEIAARIPDARLAGVEIRPLMVEAGSDM